MWEFILTALITVSLVMSLVFCLCWNRKNPKNEWLGVDGMVTQKNPDENVNHLPSSTSFVNTGVEKRNTATNTRRSLPDIPASMSTAVTWAVNGDNSSEHYATLGQYQNPIKTNGETIPSETRPSISQQSSVSQADQFSPYERVKYDKIKSKEHPYAQVQSTSRHTGYDEHDMTVEERVNLLRIETSSSNEQSVRSRRSSAHSSVGLDIPAATAVAGGVAASPDLPYMTPPVTQANFSGDSQESSKGYTSISVREPLANIIGQKTDPKRELDVHYSTVSDDSDDVYTTIADPNQIYTSESETYARINPTSVAHEVEVHHQPNDSSSSLELYEPPPTPHPVPPSVDSLKHVTHSRQASSSSSVANIGSPKPEKRQANSPLPPPPPSINVEVHNLDDLYAKVHKNGKKDDHEEKNNATVEKPEDKKLLREHNYETLKKIARNVSDPGYEKIKEGADSEPGYASINGPESIASSDPGYEVLRDRLPVDPSEIKDCENYSRVKSVLNDGYSVVNKKKPPPMLAYEVMSCDSNEPNYTTVESNGSDTDPNYESVHQNDPNYESVKDLELPYDQLENSRTSSDISGYEKIKGKNSSDSSNSESRTTDEPPYERLNNDTEVPGYEKVGGGGGDGGVSELVADIANIHEENAIFEV